MKRFYSQLKPIADCVGESRGVTIATPEVILCVCNYSKIDQGYHYNIASNKILYYNQAWGIAYNNICTQICNLLDVFTC